MKKLGRASLAIMVVLFLAACATKYEVYHVNSATKAPDFEGVFYSLPRTIVTAEIPITKTIVTPGRFARYSKELLDITAISSKKINFTIGAPVIDSKAEADPDQVFVLKLKGSWRETRELMVELNEKGLLTRGKASVEDTSLDLVIESLKVAGKIAGQAILAGPDVGIQGLEIDDLIDFETENAARALLAELDARRVSIIKDSDLDNMINSLQSTLGTERVKALRAAQSKAPSLTCHEKVDSIIAIAGFSALHPTEKTGYSRQSCKLVPLKSLSQIGILAMDSRAKSVKNAVIQILKKYKLIFLHGPQPKLIELINTLKASPLNETTIANNVVTKYFDAAQQLAYWDQKFTKDVYNFLNKKLATILAQKIVSLKDQRNRLVLGRSDTYQITGPALTEMLKQTDALISQLLSNFTGTKKAVKWNAKFEWLPPATPVSQALAKSLFTYSPGKGVKVSISHSSNPRITNLSVGRAGGFLVSSFKPTDKQLSVGVWNTFGGSQVANIIKSKTAAPDLAKPHGFFYRVPAESTIHFTELDTTPSPLGATAWTAATSGKPLGSRNLLISHYGVIRSMPMSSGSFKKSVFDINLYESTGALKSISVSGTALDPATMGSLGNIITDVQAAQISAEKAKADAAKAEAASQAADEDIINVLTRQRDILLLEQEINELENPVPDSGIGVDGAP